MTYSGGNLPQSLPHLEPIENPDEGGIGALEPQPSARQGGEEKVVRTIPLLPEEGGRSPHSQERKERRAPKAEPLSFYRT